MENIIQIYWKNPKSRMRIMVGQIEKKERIFEFKYVSNIFEIVNEEGFTLIFPFLDMNKTYTSERLFAPFLSRLPDRKRVDIKRILTKYNLETYDEFELLKRSEGRLPIDSLEFISPLNINCPISKEFFVAGVRHYQWCCKSVPNKTNQICEGSILELQIDENNSYDKYAVKIMFNNVLLGYAPVYYSKALYEAITKSYDISCYVKSVNIPENCIINRCTDCIKVILSVNPILENPPT